MNGSGLKTLILKPQSTKSIQKYNTLRSEVMEIFQSWLVKHGKVYNGIGENDKRFEIFRENLRFIDEHNSQACTYKVGLNKFAFNQREAPCQVFGHQV